MEKVAEYINEMQRVFEEYGQLFAHVQNIHQKDLKEKVSHKSYYICYGFRIVLSTQHTF